MAFPYYLSLGSNIDPADNLRAAVHLLSAYGDVAAASTVYETPPLGANESQPNYLNAVVLIRSELEPLAFQRRAIGEIESALGRNRTADKFAARTIDIDILLVGEQVLQIEHRPVPSPEILERDFVAVPLFEIAPDLVHPVDGRTIAEIAREFHPDEDTLRPRLDVDLMNQ